MALTSRVRDRYQRPATARPNNVQLAAWRLLEAWHELLNEGVRECRGARCMLSLSRAPAREVSQMRALHLLIELRTCLRRVAAGQTLSSDVPRTRQLCKADHCERVKGVWQCGHGFKPLHMLDGHECCNK